MKIMTIMVMLSLLLFAVGCQSNEGIDADAVDASDEVVLEDAVDSVAEDIADENVEEDYVEIGEMI